MEKSGIEQETSEFSYDLELYQSLATKVKGILEEILNVNNVNYLTVESRAKTSQSYRDKLNKRKEIDPEYDPKNIKDLAGIRIITYVQSDLASVRDLIKTNFDVVEYENKTEDLGIEKVGYRSEHFIAKLPLNRTCLTENKKYEGFEFEIQLRTILEHSWAEIEHDRNYKFNAELPREIKRRFSLLSAVLEMADNEFNYISEYIDNYSKQILTKTKKGDLNIFIDSISLKNYLDSNFGNMTFISPSFAFDDTGKTLIQSLRKLSIETIKDLDDIIPSDFIEKLEKHGMKENYFSLIVHVLIIKFKQKYFDRAWNNWRRIDSKTITLLEEYNVDTETIVKTNDLIVEDIADAFFES